MYLRCTPVTQSTPCLIFVIYVATMQCKNHNRQKSKKEFAVYDSDTHTHTKSETELTASVLKKDHLTTPVPKTASRSPSFLDFAVCAQTMQISKKKLRKWSTSFFKDYTPKTRSKKLSTKSDPFPNKTTTTTKKPTAAQQENGRRREIDHESPLPPLDYPRAQNHPVELGSLQARTEVAKKKKAEEMANFFVQRRYPENTVKKALDQVRSTPRKKKNCSQTAKRPPKRDRS